MLTHENAPQRSSRTEEFLSWCPAALHQVLAGHLHSDLLLPDNFFVLEVVKLVVGVFEMPVLERNGDR